MPPCVSKTCRKKSHLSAFSLIELLTVMAIAMILAGMAVLGISNSSQNARKTSREIIRSQLQQARAHAIASRNFTAIIIPVRNSGKSGLRAMSSIEVEKIDDHYVPISNENGESMLRQQWTRLPQNLHFVTSDIINSDQPTLVDHETTLILLHRGKEIECHMLIFTPQGQITFPPSGEPIHIAIAKVSNNQNAVRITEKSKGKPIFDLILVNRLTAKTQIISP